MDQLRKILAWLKQHHFWVLSGLAAVIAIACWWSAAGTLRSEFEVNQKAITDEFTSLTSLRNKPFHPNEEINAKQIEETKQQAESVADTWQRLYDRQREHVLEWPSDLSQEFREHVEKLKFEDPIPRDLRNNYQNYARRYFPELPKIVDAREMPEGQGGSYGEGMSRGGGYGALSRGGYGESGLTATGQPADEDYICEWLDQNVVREALRFPQRPSAIRIWVTQEDLWVYKTLLNVIRRTNEAAGATRISNAAVRVIYSLEVGSRAAHFSRAKGRIYMVPSAAPAGDPMMGGEGGMVGGEGERASPYGAYPTEMPGPSAFDAGRMEGYGATGSGPMTEEQERAMLLDRRYLDEQGNPIPLGGGGGGGEMMDPMMDAAAAAPAGPTEFGVEYKRLPVRMTLQMDQRWLTHLIAECANQPLQVEVREVRINPPGIGEGGGMQSYGGGRGYGGGGGGLGASLIPERTGVQTFPAQPHIVNVEIQGIIYIFNEPNPAVLQVSDEPQVAAAF